MNQKGGVGKTTSTINTGACLANMGYKVLLVDLDPQKNLTTSTGVKVEAGQHTIYNVIKEHDPKRAIIKLDNYDILPASEALSRADVELSTIAGSEFILKEALENLDYDFIIIDTSPALNKLSIMAMTASNYILIPVQAQFLAMGGFNQLIETIAIVKKRLNPNINLLGAFLTMYDSRKNLDLTIFKKMEKIFPDGVFKTTIPNNVSLAEAPAFGKNIFQYKPQSTGATAYNDLTGEIIGRIKA